MTNNKFPQFSYNHLLNSVKIIIILLFLPTLLFCQTVWTEDSFEDFRDGSFLDAGSNLYVSSKGRLQIINRWDFNNDGHLDILMPSGHGHTEKENVFIYLNDGAQIDPRSRIEIPAAGSRDGVVADFNKDGYNDIAVANSADSHFSRVNAWIWYGSADGFLPENRIELPAYKGKSIVSGDFNNDSWLDIAIACEWQAGTMSKPEGPQVSFLYWNSSQGFSAENRLPLEFDGKGATALATADLDHDNIKDLVALAVGKTFIFYSGKKAFENKDRVIQLNQAGTALSIGNINNDKFLDLAICSKNEVVVLIGNEEGFADEKNHRLMVDSPKDVELADINKDGNDDVIVANFSTPGGATWTDSYVFFSEKGVPSQDHILKLPTFGASGVTAKDLNQDGFPEVILSNQRIIHQLNINSYIYWNDNGKLYYGNHTQLPTLGTLGNTVADINNDNLPDVIFFNEEGYFRDGPTMSHVYWGDGSRNFSENRRTSFHTHHIFGQGHADFDDDGHVDLVLSQERFMALIPHEQNGLILYWGGG